MTLIIYDNAGHIFLQITDEYSTPQGGVQFLEADVPEGKQVVSVDTSVTPHQPVFEDIPPSEVAVLSGKVAEQEQAILELSMALAALQGGSN